MSRSTVDTKINSYKNSKLHVYLSIYLLKKKNETLKCADDLKVRVKLRESEKRKRKGKKFEER